MAHLLQHKDLKVYVDLPQTNYKGVRYDWTGMITKVDFRGVTLTGKENPTQQLEDNLGQGLYNEFGIKTPVGYRELLSGGWFHKIGVGLLQKDDGPYDFLKDYPVRPARFTVDGTDRQLKITCTGVLTNGYAYVLEKTIVLLDNGFEIKYKLENTGNKQIITTEYNHNFLAIGDAAIGPQYQLDYAFTLDENVLDENINPEYLVRFTGQQIKLASVPSQAFFFSDLSGSANVAAAWTLTNKEMGIAITESGNFTTKALHLWGAGHVISPELYIDLHILPGQTASWTRTYGVTVLP